MKRRVSASLEDGVAVLLDDMENASSYVNNVLSQRDTQWRGALLNIRSGRWSDPEIRLVCELLHGYQPPGYPMTVYVADAMLHAATTDMLAPRGISPQRWHGVIRRLREPSPEIAEMARVLWILGHEWWAGNTALRRALGAAA